MGTMGGTAGLLAMFSPTEAGSWVYICILGFSQGADMEQWLVSVFGEETGYSSKRKEPFCPSQLVSGCTKATCAVAAKHRRSVPLLSRSWPDWQGSLGCTFNWTADHRVPVRACGSWEQRAGSTAIDFHSGGEPVGLGFLVFDFPHSPVLKRPPGT